MSETQSFLNFEHCLFLKKNFICISHLVMGQVMQLILGRTVPDIISSKNADL